MSERTVRLGAIALIAGGLIWSAAWFLHALADGQDGTVLGLDDSGWRAAANPALPLLMAGAWVFYVRLGSRAAGIGLLAVAVVEVGLLAMLVGNLLEVGVTGRGLTEGGWGILVVGAFGALCGLLLLGVAIVRTGIVPRVASMPFAGGLAAFVAGALAIPVFGVGWLLWGYVLLAARGERGTL